MKKKTTTLEAPRILRIAAVRARVGLSTPSIYRLSRAGLFPRPIQLGTGSVGWLTDEIEGWVAERIAARDIAHGGLTSPQP